MPKRKGSPLTAKQKAQIANYRFSHLHPWNDYGAARVQRGSMWSLDNFGPSYKEATEGQKAMRKSTGFTGRGKYTFRDFEDTADRFLTKGLPKLLGAAGSVRNFLSGRGMYTGHGAYTSTDPVHHNNLITGGHSSNAVPLITGAHDETGAITIHHREYIGDIFGPTTAFNVQSYSLNPGLQSTFPWLSQIAQNYDEYEFVQCIWHWRSTTSDIGNSSTGQVGTVIMATNYNAASSPFTDKGTMLDYAHAHSCKTTEHMSHGVECDPKKVALANCLFTRSNPVISGQDLKTYDHGLFQIALCNVPTAYQNLSLGELHVEYMVTLRKPKLFVTRGLEIDQDSFCTTSVTASATATGSQVFGTVASPSILFTNQQNNIGVLLSAISNGFTLTFPAAYTGNLRVILVVSPLATVAGASLGAASFATTGNVNFVYDMFDVAGQPSYYASSQLLATGTTVGTTYDLTLDIYVKQSTGGVNNTLTVNMQPSVTSSVQSFLQIVQYNGFGLTSTTDRPVYVNNSTKQVVTIPF